MVIQILHHFLRIFRHISSCSIDFHHVSFCFIMLHHVSSCFISSSYILVFYCFHDFHDTSCFLLIIPIIILNFSELSVPSCSRLFAQFFMVFHHCHQLLNTFAHVSPFQDTFSASSFLIRFRVALIISECFILSYLFHGFLDF